MQEHFSQAEIISWSNFINCIILPLSLFDSDIWPHVHYFTTCYNMFTIWSRVLPGSLEVDSVFVGEVHSTVTSVRVLTASPVRVR